jgi:serine phosphatase RsbU (regulator of sigma subunit)
MAQVVHSLLHHYEDETQPAHLLELLNQKYGDLAPPNLLATAVSAAYLPDSGEFRFSNAGQPRPARWSARRHEWTLVQPTSKSDCGLPLGVRFDACYTEESVVLAEGDALFLSSDGLHEARNAENEFLEPEGVLRQLNDSTVDISPGATLAELAASFLRRLEEFRGGRDFNDDVMMLWIRRWPKSAQSGAGREDSRSHGGADE